MPKYADDADLGNHILQNPALASSGAYYFWNFGNKDVVATRKLENRKKKKRNTDDDASSTLV